MITIKCDKVYIFTNDEMKKPDITISGGFSIKGNEQTNDAMLQQASAEMTENFRIAIQRLARRN